MLIPLGTDRPSIRPTLITPLLIALNVVVFTLQAILEARAADGATGIEGYHDAIEPFLLVPDAFRWYQPITSGFMHADVLHIAGNMLFLWVFGPSIEDRFGRWWFLAFYVGGLFAAAGLHVAFEHNPALGASGAIAALTGAYLVLFPRTQIKVLFMLWFGVFWVSAWWLIGLAVLWDIAGQAHGSSGIAHLAHLGGTAYGVVVSLIVLWLKLVPREVYDLFSIARQASRRRQLRELSQSQQRAVDRHWEKARKKKAEAGAGGRVGIGAAAAPGNAGRHEQVDDQDALALARAEIVRLLGADDLAAAAAAYKQLVESHAAGPGGGATTFSYKHQDLIATHFYAVADYAAAAYAMERLIEMYPREPGTRRFRLSLAIINSRYLNDPIRAKLILKDLLPELHDESERALAERELADLG